MKAQFSLRAERYTAHLYWPRDRKFLTEFGGWIRGTFRRQPSKK